MRWEFMRFPFYLLLVLPIVGCHQAGPPPKPSQPVAVAKYGAKPTATDKPQLTLPTPPVSTTTPGPVRMTSASVSGITIEGVAFDSRDYRLAVADQSGGPGSRFADSASAGKSMGGIAAVNAGFFTPEGKPLGLVVSSGKKAGSWNSASSLGNAAWYDGASSGAGIARREKIGRSGTTSMRELIQAGPLLVENGSAVGGLEDAKTSARMVVLWDGGTRWWIGRGSPSTLADFARALVSAKPAGWPVKQALNLDGGRSSDLWISGGISGGPLVRRTPWNRPVRNFLVLVRR